MKEVHQVDATHVRWRTRFAGVECEWETEITEQRPDKQIAWRSTSGIANTGVVTFHRLDDRSTRVTVSVEADVEALPELSAKTLQSGIEEDLERFKLMLENRAGDGRPARTARPAGRTAG